MDKNRAIGETIARSAITEVLARYAHAVDRCDADLLDSVYWPEATDDHGLFSGKALEFGRFIIPLLKQETRSMHFISNILVVFDTEVRARVQCYFMAFHERDGRDGAVQYRVGGRYLDVFDCRHDEWRIAGRVVLMDWNESGPSTSTWDESANFSSLKRGRRHPDDASRAWLAATR